MWHRLLMASGILTALVSAPLLGGQGVKPTRDQAYVAFEPLKVITVTPGHSTEVRFTFHIRSGYYINSEKPTAADLLPASLGFSPPQDVIIAKVHYPAGPLVEFSFDPGKKLSVYSGDATIRAVIIAQRKAVPGNYTVHGEFRYQACDVNAMYPPEKVPVQFDLKVSKAAGSSRPGRIS